ncbi:4'-phosphopantetheinyl transferase family protein [Fervidibacillus albus]|uniref:4'-phosphopantetheinyl transferase superfamily protein n=1 Tax=Fervidibacillus albus TaxID=2980026 RepID=A0A9E8RWN8_9BACI|nr:4'-phosphopantetheinyl transferase superfamily protein [Fervidibacillus albus]WAA10278.1 4'-phosphopantetheinyl transferase superfamily protein [Fervidibacillus albus]
MIQIHVLKIEETKLNEIDETLIPLIDPTKRNRIRRSKNGKIILWADILVRTIICEQTGMYNHQLIFSTGKYGKPFLANDRNVHFNVSHSGEWIVAAFSDEPVGIDIEKIEPIEEVVVQNVLRDEEFNRFQIVSPESREQFFYHLWTVKESFIKLIGKGLSFPIEKCSIDESRSTIRIEPNFKTSNRDAMYFYKQYFIDPDYQLSVCSRKKEFSSTIQQWMPNKLFHHFTCYVNESIESGGSNDRCVQN